MNIEIKAIIIVWTSKFGPSKADACESAIVLSLISFLFPQNLSLSFLKKLGASRNLISEIQVSKLDTWESKWKSFTVHSVFKLRLSNYLWPVFDWVLENVHLLSDLMTLNFFLNFFLKAFNHAGRLSACIFLYVPLLFLWSNFTWSAAPLSCIVVWQVFNANYIFNACLVDSLIVKLFLTMAPLTFLIIKYA